MKYLPKRESTYANVQSCLSNENSELAVPKECWWMVDVLFAAFIELLNLRVFINPKAVHTVLLFKTIKFRSDSLNSADQNKF